MMPLINPYNFVPLRDKWPDRTTGYPKWRRFQGKGYSGILECTLTVLSPLISLDQRNYSLHTLKDDRGNPLQRRGEQCEDIKVFKFLRNSQDKPILQGTSLKGLIRSIYETITDSCLTLAVTSKSGKTSYTYEDLGEYSNRSCCDIGNLCPACQLFGTIEGEGLHCQGRVSFSDAILIEKQLVSKRCYLSELSSPKPYHCAIYGKTKRMNGPIAGRKFYYHQDKNTVFWVEEKRSNDRSRAIEEYAPVGSKFSFHVKVENLNKDELGNLLLAIELHNGLGHKIGLGKAIGLGSCCINVKLQESFICQPQGRYTDWDKVVAVADWPSLKADPALLPEGLIEVLRLNKPESREGAIGYPLYNQYPSAPIDAKGVFGGSVVKGGRPSSWSGEESAAPLTASAPGSALTSESTTKVDVVSVPPPQVPPPIVRQDEEAAWLKEICGDWLVFVDIQGKEMRRKRSGFQGKANLLEPSKWFILSGTNTSKRVL